MESQNDIKTALWLQNIPAYETDIPYIQDILRTMYQAKTPLQVFPYLNTARPALIFDKGLIR